MSLGLPKPAQPSCLAPAAAPRITVALQDPFTHHDTTRIPQVSVMKSPHHSLKSSPLVCLMVCMTPWQLQGVHPSQRGSRTLQSHSTPCSSACSGSPHSRSHFPTQTPGSTSHIPLSGCSCSGQSSEHPCGHTTQSSLPGHQDSALQGCVRAAEP